MEVEDSGVQPKKSDGNPEQRDVVRDDKDATPAKKLQRTIAKVYKDVQTEDVKKLKASEDKDEDTKGKESTQSHSAESRFTPIKPGKAHILIRAGERTVKSPIKIIGKASKGVILKGKKIAEN